MMRCAIVRRAIDASQLVAEVQRGGNGATVLFLGTVRDVNEGRPVSGMEYTAYEPMAEQELARICAEAADRFQTADLVVEHRVGTLELGEVSVAIAIAHGHRAPAFEGARYIIEELKRRVPIWKLEHYTDGTREWVDPIAVAATGAAVSHAAGVGE
jgi:molybdopterin synthase catalytic subunit